MSDYGNYNVSSSPDWSPIEDRQRQVETDRPSSTNLAYWDQRLEDYNKKISLIMNNKDENGDPVSMDNSQKTEKLRNLQDSFLAEIKSSGLSKTEQGVYINYFNRELTEAARELAR